MKKLLGIVVLVLFWCNPSFSFIKGKGELKFSDRALEHFVNYIHAKFTTKNSQKKPTPGMFIISSNGNWTTAWFCPWKACQDPGSSESIKTCERETGVECGVFAARRTIYWDNGINTKNKKAKINSSMTFGEIKSELIRLGFYGQQAAKKIEKKETKTKIKKKKEASVDTDTDIVKKIKELKKLFDDGVLTKEEFEKAKKKLLN